MAIYHLSCKPPVSRSQGRSCTAAAAYRGGVAIRDERTGLLFDYRRRKGVVSAVTVLPGGRQIADRAAFWNAVELHHKRKDAVLAREVIVALPSELGEEGRAVIAMQFAHEIADRFAVGVDIALHEPSPDGDDRNYHCHLLMTACCIDGDGKLGRKSEALDPIACRRAGKPDSASWLRPRWEHIVNTALLAAGSKARIDHRSHKARGVQAIPSVHVGWRGAAARARASLNNRLWAKNIRAQWIDADIEKLLRIRSRLARTRLSAALESPAEHAVLGEPSAGFRRIKVPGQSAGSRQPLPPAQVNHVLDREPDPRPARRGILRR